ncbi:MAG: hypothetical protein FDZ69_14100 [Deltaproteobacteria bacterium]|nr:MAG: hypothetical protein FDZ69_14100 [Deltaproteobacteria bacterium]
MKRLLVNILLVAGLVLTASYAVDGFLLEGLRRSSKNKFGKMNDIVAGRINAEILFSGSSRTIYHFDPKPIAETTGASVYNIGLSGAQAKVQLALLKTYLEHNRQPGIIVQGLDLISLFDKQDVFNPELFVPYLREEELFRPLAALDKAYYRYRYLPMYAFAVHQELKSLAVNGWLGREGRQTLDRGYQGQDKVWTDDFETFRAQHPGGYVQPYDAALLTVFQEIVDICRTRGIRLVFVYTPEFVEMQSFTVNRREIITLLRDFAARNRVEFIDYSDSEMCRNRSLFYNSQHLNRRGADILSRDIAARLQLRP